MSNNFSESRALREELDSFLKQVDLSNLLQFVLAMDLTQSDPPSSQTLTKLPPEAITNDASSPYFAHKWRLETLVNQALSKCPDTSLLFPNIKNGRLSYGGFVYIYNLLSRLEEAEFREIQYNTSIFDELHRLTQRQFEWQRGFSSLSQIYRYAYLFDGPLCRHHILSKFGYTYSDLSLFCLGIKTLTQGAPAVAKSIDLREVFLSPDRKHALIERLSTSIGRDNAICKCSNTRTVTYSKSLLKSRPLVSTRDMHVFHAPLPALVAARATVNSYYDFYGINGSLRNEIGQRFELYTYKLLKLMLPDCFVKQCFKYKINKKTVKSLIYYCTSMITFQISFLSAKARE